MSTERVSSGIEGLDKIISGGLPKNSFTLLTGACGTGKFIFSMNFLLEGISKGENALYISLEETKDETIAQAEDFGFKISKFVKDGKLNIIVPELYDWDRLIQVVEDAITSSSAKRCVINSSTHIGAYFKDNYKVREALLELMKVFKKFNVTVISISEKPEHSEQLSSYGVEEFIADGVIVLHYSKKEKFFVRGLSIRKMRGTTHSTEIHSLTIKSPKGIIVYPSEEVFTEV